MKEGKRKFNRGVKEQNIVTYKAQVWETMKKVLGCFLAHT